MVVQSPASGPVALFGGRHTAHVAPVVVAEEHRHVVGHAHPLVVVIQHLFIQRPHLRCLLGRPAGHVGDDSPLILHDALHEPGVGLLTHGLVTVAAHTDGHDIFRPLHALDALPEEAIKHGLVGLIVPRPVVFAPARPLLMVACHGFVVGSAHDDAHLIGCATVFRVVGIEGPAPHGRPQHVALEAQDEFKHAGIESVVAIIGAVGVLHPRSETGSLVIEKEPTIAHSRFAVGVDATGDVDAVVAGHGHIGPVIPRRDTHLAGEFVDAVDGAPPVAARNDELPAHKGDDVFLAPATKQTAVEQPALHQSVDGCRVAECPDEDAGTLVSAHNSLCTTHFTDIGGKIAGGYGHAFQVAGIQTDAHATPVVEQHVAGVEVHKTVGSRQLQGKQQKQEKINACFHVDKYGG